jgi:hypothetical protein
MFGKEIDTNEIVVVCTRGIPMLSLFVYLGTNELRDLTERYKR